jgi:integrative and conjugative element protein (TIGR02256 family)
MSLRFVIMHGGPAIILSDEALATMDRFRQINPRDKEAGGQLFARIEGIDTVIVEATPPGWLDRRARYRFWPNCWFQQREIRDRYAKGLHFVGDWHTHPEAMPRPSCEDIRNMVECFKASLHDLRAFVMIVVGTASAPEGLHVALIDGHDMLRLDPDTTVR